MKIYLTFCDIIALPNRDRPACTYRQVEFPIVPRVGDFICGFSLCDDTLSQVSSVELHSSGEIIVILEHDYSTPFGPEHLPKEWTIGWPKASKIKAAKETVQ